VQSDRSRIPAGSPYELIGLGKQTPYASRSSGVDCSPRLISESPVAFAATGAVLWTDGCGTNDRLET